MITERMYAKTEQRRRLGMMGRTNVLNSFSSERYLREHEQMLWVGKYQSPRYLARRGQNPFGLGNSSKVHLAIEKPWTSRPNSSMPTANPTANPTAHTTPWASRRPSIDRPFTSRGRPDSNDKPWTRSSRAASMERPWVSRRPESMEQRPQSIERPMFSRRVTRDSTPTGFLTPAYNTYPSSPLASAGNSIRGVSMNMDDRDIESQQGIPLLPREAM